MTIRPTSITVFALYLLIVFGISMIGNLYGAARELPPYTSAEWLILMAPQLLAFAAGVALWRMLKLGAWLWFASVLVGWSLAVFLGTGFFPNITIAFVVSLAIVAISVWVLIRNWHLLGSPRPSHTPLPERGQ